ncbi:3,4-dihydroxy-2-butanone-4-phosphate synthase [Alkalihalobacillus sp. MEB130]|uniref:3,4-dihydroxy-2-butanone-4-phosphate synthase n=1 Tax=Alkalihalobacillus sp. MEB130 TaxID=2976704 RepID=UPI0028DD8EF8|nr:3,4-dihydroxy-2-butanone-4-phosphate synthase [Alkalihalobacillus sp. MEB130]MDT8860713.1 3,4-dihydroxy-2-butanone-4-phosphate synthase [Alkalihalobacillus sp. MEB130]
MCAEFASIHSAIQDLKAGKMVIVVDRDDRENEGDLVCLAEAASPENINFMTKYGKGLVCVPMAEELLNRLQIPLMVKENEDKYRTAFTVSVDHIQTGTGISAQDRALTIQELLNLNSKPEDFRKPGHVFPLQARQNGVLERDGHTEAAVDLARLAHATPAAVICEVMNDDGTMARLPELQVMARHHQLKIISIQDLIAYRKRKEKLVERKSVHKLTVENKKLSIYMYNNYLTNSEHILVLNDNDTAERIIDIYVETAANKLLQSIGWSHKDDLKERMKKLEQEEPRGVFCIRKEQKKEDMFTNMYSKKNLNQTCQDAELLHDDYVVMAKILKDLGINKIRLSQSVPEVEEILLTFEIIIMSKEPKQVL